MLRRFAGLMLIAAGLITTSCGPGAPPVRGPNAAAGCPDQRLLRVTNDTDATVEVILQEGTARRQIGTVVGRGSSVFQVPNGRGVGVQTRPYDRELIRHEFICG